MRHISTPSSRAAAHTSTASPDGGTLTLTLTLTLTPTLTPTLTRSQLLEAAGWRVVHIDHTQWRAACLSGRREAFLAQNMAAVGVTLDSRARLATDSLYPGAAGAPPPPQPGGGSWDRLQSRTPHLSRSSAHADVPKRQLNQASVLSAKRQRLAGSAAPLAHTGSQSAQAHHDGLVAGVLRQGATRGHTWTGTHDAGAYVQVRPTTPAASAAAALRLQQLLSEKEALLAKLRQREETRGTPE